MIDKRLRLILLVAFVDLVGFGLIIPLQAVYAERLGASGFVFGLIIGVYAAMQIVFNPLLGRWSDRVGRRPVLILSVAGSVLSHVLLGLADLAHSLPLLFMARMLDGITGANIATVQAYIADVTHDADRAKGMGLFGAAFGVGFIVGPALGAGLAAVGHIVSGPEYGTSWPAFGAAAIAFIALILVWRRLPEPPRERGATLQSFGLLDLTMLRGVLQKPRMRPLLTLIFGVTFAFVLLEVTLVYLCRHSFGIGERGTGLIFVYLGVLMVIVQGGLVGRMAKRFGEVKLVSLAPFCTGVGFLILSGVALQDHRPTAWVLLFVGALPTVFGQGMTGPSLHALISRQADSGRQGATLGIAQGVSSLARAIAPPVGGLLFDFGPHWPYLAGAVLFMALGLFGVTMLLVPGRGP
jgi:MFS transporter, DHA1 family, tetracycline resistance protein